MKQVGETSNRKQLLTTDSANAIKFWVRVLFCIVKAIIEDFISVINICSLEYDAHIRVLYDFILGNDKVE